ncbi:intercellular adhesion molecule 5 [Danio aesculapii]|uniref:intercellular adhesion molecule 5 n=1 Tax=Danio aesculapii TaxID=1142201 RepID=UPI0024BFA4F6|nr:intercellular adhesion molecule 5 [Danio aesculapii]
MLTMHRLQQFIALLLITLASGDDCPVSFNLPGVVVKYGAPFSVNCSTNITDYLGLSWEPNEEAVENTSKIYKTLVGEWESELSCYIFFNDTHPCSQNLSVTIYKTPDSASISALNHTGPMMEGNQYELQCDVYNVAPAQSLTVNWYKGEKQVYQTNFTDKTKSPINITFYFPIQPDRADDGAQFRCEAELNLGEEVPRAPTVTSKPLNVTVEYDCPVSFNLPEVVVKYGTSFLVNCSTNITDYLGLSWESNEEAVENTGEIYKTLVGEWESELSCYIFFNHAQSCSRTLSVTIYKTPNSVSISTVNHTGPMKEGNQYELQCDVHNVAPAQSLTVNWYKRGTLVNQTNFTDTIKSPVSKTSRLLIHPNRYDDGAQYRCEAELKLGKEGPQPPPKNTSEPLNITVTYGDCPIELNPRRAVVKYGSSVSADCKAFVPHKGIGWESTVGAVPLSDQISLTKWRVSELKDWDIQPPFCFMNYEKQCTVDLPITIYKTPDSVSISTGNQIMMEGNQYELQCDVHNVAPAQNLTVNWYKGETLVNQTSFTDKTKSSVNITSSLLIGPDRTDNGAQFRCEAELKLGEEGPQPPPKNTSEPLSITVHYAPEIKSCQPWSPKKGSSLDSYPKHLHSLVGNPHPSISWKHNSSPVNSSAPLTKNDSGQYEITASNHYGDSNCTISITVEYSPELTCEESYEVKEADADFSPCDLEGEPKPELSLYKEGKRIQLSNGFKWNDSGLYQLTARNQHGSVNKSFAIIVLHAPRLFASQEHFDVAKDSRITLQCNSSGNPEPEMWWSFNNKNISTGRRYIPFTIEKATSTSAGVYTCSATNKFGRQDKVFTVKIKDNSRSDIPIAVVVILLIVLLLICLFLFLWRRHRVRRYYDVTLPPSKSVEMVPLSNGGSK